MTPNASKLAIALRAARRSNITADYHFVISVQNNYDKSVIRSFLHRAINDRAAKHWNALSSAQCSAINERIRHAVRLGAGTHD